MPASKSKAAANASPQPTATLTLLPAPAGPAPRAPRRVEWLPLQDEGDYANHQVQARIRYPDSLNTEFGSGDFSVIKNALRQVVLAHNGWVNPDTDQPYPPATDDGFWDELAQEEILLMLRAVGAARKKALSFLLATPSS